MKRRGWVLAAVGSLVLGSTVGCTTAPPTGTPTATGAAWPGQLGSLSQAGADDITGANPGAALVVDELVGDDGPTHSSLVLVDPVARSVLTVLDLAETDLADAVIVDVGWSRGQAEAQVVLERSYEPQADPDAESGSKAPLVVDDHVGAEVLAGTLDLLTGDLTIDQTIPEAWALGLRSDGALVAQVVGDADLNTLVVAEDGGVRELGTVPAASYVTMDPSGTYAVSLISAGASSSGYRVMDLMTGALSSHEWGDGLSGDITGWAGDAMLAASVSATVTQYPGGFSGPTDQDGALRLVVDVSDGSVVERTPLAAGDPWLVTVDPLGGGQVAAAGWPVPAASEVETWGEGEESMPVRAEHACLSHAYAGSWADGLAEVEVVGDWPLMVLGGSGRYSYIETSAGACEGDVELGPLEVHDGDTGSTTTVLLPDGDLTGSWALFPMGS